MKPTWRKFNTFTDLVEFRKVCPLCSSNMIFEITTTSTLKKTSLIKKIQNRLEHIFDAEGEWEDIIVSFKPAETEKIEIKELNITLHFDTSVGSVDDIETALTLFDLKIYCPHEIIGNGYEAKASFDLNADYADEHQIVRNGNKYVLSLDNIRMDYEIFKICNVHFDGNKPNGNFIKILHDYHIDKTSFSMAEVNLDGSCGSWKEKRINLVNDDFFKFHDSEKVYSRINSIFLLQ
jgi:hypothetical protein